MSAEAQLRLQRLWEKLSFHKVRRTIARQPEDVLCITIESREPGGHSRYTNVKRVADLPSADRPLATIAWRHFYGFTTDNVHFNQQDCHGLDVDIDLTMTWSYYSNTGHKGTFDRPKDDSWIYGIVEDTPRGKHLAKWAPCTEAFKLLVEAIRGEVTLSEDELGRKLLVDGFPDSLWAIARLVLFDNVQVFVDNAKGNDRLIAEGVAKHPAAGLQYGSHGLKVYDYGMQLGKGSAEYVHLLSHHLNEPNWWSQFKRLAEEQGVYHSHPRMGGWCEACAREDDPDENMFGFDRGWN